MNEVCAITMGSTIRVNFIVLNTKAEPKSYDVANYFMDMVIHSLDNGHELIVEVDGKVF